MNALDMEEIYRKGYQHAVEGIKFLIDNYPDLTVSDIASLLERSAKNDTSVLHEVLENEN